MKHGTTVLVADDNAGIRTTIVAILTSLGYVVTEAGDGEAALAALANQPMDVAVFDVRMPKRDGISVVEELHPEPPPPGIVIVSAYEFDRDIRQRLGSRVVKYLRKPVPPEQLIRAVREAEAVAGQQA